MLKTIECIFTESMIAYLKSGYKVVNNYFLLLCRVAKTVVLLEGLSQLYVGENQRIGCYMLQNSENLKVEQDEKYKTQCLK